MAETNTRREVLERAYDAAEHPHLWPLMKFSRYQLPGGVRVFWKGVIAAAPVWQAVTAIATALTAWATIKMLLR